MGKAGRAVVKKTLPDLRAEHNPDLVLANAENLAHGKGINLKTITEMFDAGIDFFTSGNHVFDKAEAKLVFEKFPDKIIRPANFDDSLPGAGFKVIETKGQKVLIANLNGQVFMEKQYEGTTANPFKKYDEILNLVGRDAVIRILDLHAEATSEKRGMGFWCDGRLSLFVGTHTHVQSADAQILPQGTGYITDLGMVGAAQSIIGISRESALKRFLADENVVEGTSLEIAENDKYEVAFIVAEIDEASGKCKNISSFLKTV
ncbi:YmdB family metallophosphoesterase [bacterium]|nr:MAG: YmdB family metallophosphoesterase [bacterium]